MLCVTGKEARDIGEPAHDAHVLGEVLLWLYHWGWELIWVYGGLLWQCGCVYG